MRAKVLGEIIKITIAYFPQNTFVYVTLTAANSKYPVNQNPTIKYFQTILGWFIFILYVHPLSSRSNLI